jgi:hypothetical protein
MSFSVTHCFPASHLLRLEQQAIDAALKGNIQPDVPSIFMRSNTEGGKVFMSFSVFAPSSLSLRQRRFT